MEGDVRYYPMVSYKDTFRASAGGSNQCIELQERLIL
jgi:hypothetical protein